MSRRAWLERFAERYGFVLETWAPGDGTRRYRFSERSGDAGGLTNISPVLMGISDAETWTNGYAAAAERY